MRQGARVFAFLLLAAIGATSQCAQASHLTVNCDKKDTIHETLKFLAITNPQGPNTVVVSGNCKENVSIQSMDRLILITKKGATIADRSNGASAVVDIEDSRGVTLQGFTINGGGTGVTCGASSICYLTSNTVQDVLGQGVSVFGGSHAHLDSNVIQNNSFRGATVSDGSQMFSSNDIFQGNGAQGVAVTFHAYFEASNSSFLNNAVGVEASVNSTARLSASAITGSVGNGTTLLGSAAALFQGTTVTANGGDGVYLEDGSFAGFIAGSSITGNLSGTDVNCGPQTPATHFVANTGGITNCTEAANAAQQKIMK
jgi:PHD/YefM family antitoxin component YafN of YafNO toxin-antitoxin module